MRLVASTFLLALLPVVAVAQSSPLQPAEWLAGCWELRAGTRVTTEMWMPAAADIMVGGSRTVVNGTTREFEHLRLKADAGKLVYVALPSGQSETSFTSTMVSDTSLVFENPQHDFPQRIIYRHVGADSLVARVEGPGPDGPRGFSLPMKRVECR